MQIHDAWDAGARNVLAVAPTGSGKTVLFSHILSKHRGAAVAIAHRQELVSQISLSLAAFGIKHNIIGPKSTVKYIAHLHRKELGVCFYDPAAWVAVAGVDTLIRRKGAHTWANQVSLWIMDEGHHLLRENKWNKAVQMFPNSRGLGVTATPCRADGKGLGAHADGVFDAMVEGPSMRDLINEGYLSDYRILCPASDIDLSSVPVSKVTGDYVPAKLRAASRKSHLVGDIVEHYKRHAMGKRGVTFVSDVESAHETAARFNTAGVPAAAVSAKTPDKIRRECVRRLQNRELLQLVNVDLFGEGFDLPSIGVASFGRATKSYTIYVQQFGRPLRPSENGEPAIILDHVANVAEHNGPPDVPRVWSLDRRESRAKGVPDPDMIPQKICVKCTQPFEAVYKICPYCMAPVEPGRRDGPEFVEGDLVEMDAETLARMRGEIDRVDETPEALAVRMRHGGAPAVAVVGAQGHRRKLHAAQRSLRRMISLYGGIQNSRGRSDSEGHRRFYFRYRVDVMSAQALGRADTEALTHKIIRDIGEGRV